MTRFEVTMMCTACKWKITDELKKKGFDHFEIDMDSSILTFEGDVNKETIERIVNHIGYQINYVENKEELTDEEIALYDDAIRNGYTK